jgi:hypothetical protein
MFLDRLGHRIFRRLPVLKESMLFPGSSALANDDAGE